MKEHVMVKVHVFLIKISEKQLRLKKRNIFLNLNLYVSCDNSTYAAALNGEPSRKPQRWASPTPITGNAAK